MLKAHLEGALFALRERHNREECLEHLDAIQALLPDHILEGRYLQPVPNIDGWMNDRELEWLYHLGQTRDRIVEIGSWCGRSTHAILSGSSQHGGRVWAVDHFLGSFAERIDGSHARAKTDDIRKEFLANCGSFKNLVLLDIPSDQAVLLFDDESADAVFIDGGHDFASIKKDLEIWAPKVKFGGLLCGHDIDLDGVPKALLELHGRRPKAVAGSIWALQKEGSGWVDFAEVSDERKTGSGTVLPGPR